jgi:hypothetical protein
MLFRALTILSISLGITTAALAQTASSNNSTATKWQPNPEHNTILPEITKAIGSSAVNNIINAEQIFCYQIAAKPENYTGYTLDGMAIVGFCGMINDQLNTLIKSELMMNPDNLNFTQNEKCTVRPQIMLRFVRGVDTTDVLFSTPCYALAFFYGGKVSAFNAKTAGPIIDAIVEPLTKNKIDFASPALLNQLLPVGVPQTDAQKVLVNRKNAPIRNWQNEQAASAARTTGWNKLKSKN